MLLGDPGFHRLTGRVGQLEFDRLRRFLLHDRGPGDRLSTVCDILYFEPDEVTTSKLAVDGQIEQGQIEQGQIEQGQIEQGQIEQGQITGTFGKL